MKKGLLAILLAIALVAPVFATDKGAMEADVKLGYIVSNNIDFDWKNSTTYCSSASTDSKIILGADFYYYVLSQVGLGVGINNIFDSTETDYKGDYTYEDKYGFTNIYFAVKPKIDLQSDVFTSVYLIGQLGYGFVRLNYDGCNVDVKNDLYWGIGAGAEIMKNFIFELIYSCNNGSYKTLPAGDDSADIKYSAFSINLGYKFNF